MNINISRTYPQPDSPNPKLGPRERAMAVFKYLLDLEPEEAVRHALFPCIVHAFEQAVAISQDREHLEPSLVPEIRSGPKKIDGTSIKPYGADKL